MPPPQVGHSQPILAPDLPELREALRRLAGPDVNRLMKAELRAIANEVRNQARAGVSNRSGRGKGDLARSIRASVTQRGASVYSGLPYARVQDEGGRVGHGAILKRADVSQYMTRATRNSQATVSRRLQGLLDAITSEFER